MHTPIDAMFARLRRDFEPALAAAPQGEFADIVRDIGGMDAGSAMPPDCSVDVAEARLALTVFHDIRPLLAPSQFHAQPIAVSLAAESAPVFRAGEISASVQAVSIRDVAAARIAYIDVPHGAFPVGDAAQIRAIILVPDAGGLRMLAALCPLRSNRARFFSWQLGQDAVVGAAELTGWVRDLPARIMVGINLATCEPPIGDVLGRTPRRIRKLLREVEKVALLAVAQLRSIADAGDGALLAHIPHVALTDPQRHRGNVRKVERENSIFRLKRLPHLRGVTVLSHHGSPAECRGSIPNDSDCPRRRVTVRSHYRMQPSGPGRELRRLIQIDAHIRWVLDDGRVEMVELDPEPTDR